MWLLLVALTVLSLWLFWRRFDGVLRRIIHARRDADFQLNSIGPRLWHFFAEVLCQSKVIRERPLPGLAHAFVFWAFCAFALVTLNHFAEGFGVGFLDYHRGFGAFYFWFAFVFAAVCAVSIAALAFRRFVIRPVWLGPLSYESGVIAGLIFLLMITYMPQWWVPRHSIAGTALWWVHILTILAFLPLIPHTKHLHLVLSPLTIFLEAPRYSVKFHRSPGMKTSASYRAKTSLRLRLCRPTRASSAGAARNIVQPTIQAKNSIRN